MDSFLKQSCSKEWQHFVEHHKQVIEVDENSYIFKEGDAVKGVFIMNSGKAKVFSNTPDGKEVIIRLVSDGYIIGHRGFGGDWTYPVSAMTYVKSKVTFIPIEVFNVIAKSNAEFTYRLMMFFAEELRRSEENSSLIPVRNKIANAILYNLSVFGFDSKIKSQLSYTMSRKDYASFVNTTYETVIRVLSEFNKSKIIELNAKSIRILNLPKLNEIATQSILEQSEIA